MANNFGVNQFGWHQYCWTTKYLLTQFWAGPSTFVQQQNWFQPKLVAPILFATKLGWAVFWLAIFVCAKPKANAKHSARRAGFATQNPAPWAVWRSQSFAKQSYVTQPETSQARSLNRLRDEEMSSLRDIDEELRRVKDRAQRGLRLSKLRLMRARGRGRADLFRELE